MIAVQRLDQNNSSTTSRSETVLPINKHIKIFQYMLMDFSMTFDIIAASSVNL